jgi:hypothetical protein
MTNIVFVDIDGPLLPGKMHMFKENRSREKFATPMFDPWAIRCFNVWTKYADAKAVLSTNWVHSWEVDKLMDIMAQNGLELNWHEQPVTPKRFSSSRHTEILDWLEDNTDVEGDRFIAVDDDTTCNHIRPIIDEMHRNIHILGDWIEVDFMNGISWKNFEDGCKHLGIDMEDIKEGEFGIKKLTAEEKEQRQKDLELLARCMV